MVVALLCKKFCCFKINFLGCFVLGGLVLMLLLFWLGVFRFCIYLCGASCSRQLQRLAFSG